MLLAFGDIAAQLEEPIVQGTHKHPVVPTLPYLLLAKLPFLLPGRAAQTRPRLIQQVMNS